MVKINNEQRNAFARMLEVKVKENKSLDWWDWKQESRHDETERKIEKELGLTAIKEKIEGLEEQERKIKKDVDSRLEKYRKEFEREKKENDKSLKLAIRDIWATDSVEEAKKIVSQFV